MNAAHPFRRINLLVIKNSRQTRQSQDGYFLWVKLSIATISIAMDTISCNSLYVLM